MTTFHELLLARLEQGGFSTEETLASFLPLARQVVLEHAAGKVAPLDGVAALHVEGIRIWYHESAAHQPARNKSKVATMDRPVAGVEILGEHKRTIDVEHGHETRTNLLIASRDEEIDRPVYLPGYVCWEHQVGHHDPLSDGFCLGMILASLSLGLDFNQPEDLQTFVANRRNLFRLQPQLHPVVAKAVVRLTEVSRLQRPQDLATVIGNLENYRDQDVDFEFAVACAEAGGASGGGRTRRQVILGRLQERLFEISRRNPLLHFRPTLSAVNLTQASVPLAFDAHSIRPEQILTWKGDFARSICAGDPVSLSRHLNFAEQLYLPSVLDRLRASAARDAAEFGFEQLRLAICFLRWADVKQSPPEHYDSPLVLLPVRLVKKKGVRDSYWLQPLSTEAELNPVVRHLFKQLYDIDLPVTVDLAETTLDQLYQDLEARITASEPGLTLNRVDRPRIEVIQDLARRRLDRYRRTARLSGRGIHSFLDVDYSYDPANFHPLGLALFRHKVRPSSTHLREIVHDGPTPRAYMAPPAAEEVATTEKERKFYALLQEADDNPYHWDFDLCRLTLANLKYRKMTLVRDYVDLLGNGAETPSFDAVFSLAPRPLDLEPAKAPPLEERFHIVSCDPTQASAVGHARTGSSYIIQGPPGTGKSQTITNLVADYVMRGKKVLFVCEKRAAIDVVYARLRQRGLHSLCCLIHDSQTDKKEFILDLKLTYEGLLAEQQNKPGTWQRRRESVLRSLARELEPLEQFDQAMKNSPALAGLTVRRLLERACLLAEITPTLLPSQAETLPEYAQWVRHADAVEALAAAIREIQADGILAHHPLRPLSARVARHERPAHAVTSGLRTAEDQLGALTRILRDHGVPGEAWETLADARAVVDYASAVELLARQRLMVLLDEQGGESRRLAASLKKESAARRALAKVQEANRHWTDKLAADEVQVALEQARTLEGRLLSLLNPAWWRLRKVLQARYRFEAHAVKPTWLQVLTALDHEYKCAAAVAEAGQDLREELAVDEPLEALAARVQQARQLVEQLPPKVRILHATLMKSGGGADLVPKILEAAGPARALHAACSEFLEDFETRPLDELRDELKSLGRSLAMLPDYLFCLEQLGRLPARLAAAFRSIPLDVRAMEAAIVARSVDELLQTDRVLNRFNGTLREGHVRELARMSATWHEANAGAVLEAARAVFLEQIRVSSLPAAQLSSGRKEFKAAYNRGRRELEHEFGKVMRHRSIRDMVAGDSGLVVRDLKPVWLMSPLSVSDTLPLKCDAFDVVIFDEASQITVESAVPSIFRAGQAIVVGDEMQLPPTDFFSARTESEDEEGMLAAEDGQVFEYDLSSNSFLNHASKNLASRMLGWHYRSRSESLIGFSNHAFYEGKLLTVPEDRVGMGNREEIVATSASCGASNAALLLDRPVSFHWMRHGIYENRRNHGEAAYIAEVVRAMLGREERPTIGIVAFSEAQQGEIESALSDLAEQDKAFAEALEQEYDRQVDGQCVGLLVKNLENIQGDERDVIILSVCYGPGPNGKMRMNFGPINQSGGEKRLNVAFSRAKLHMAVVSSIRHADITNDYNTGANCLRSYLQYAAACSTGETATSQRVLRELAVWRDAERHDEPAPDAVVQGIASALRQRGYQVDLSVGLSRFRCDIAVRRHGEMRYRLGVLVDTDAHYQQDDLLERELLRPQLLRAFGWTIAHVLTRDWHRDRDAVLDNLVRLVEQGDEPARPAVPNPQDDDPWADFDGSVERAETEGVVEAGCGPGADVGGSVRPAAPSSVLDPGRSPGTSRPDADIGDSVRPTAPASAGDPGRSPGSSRSDANVGGSAAQASAVDPIRRPGTSEPAADGEVARVVPSPAAPPTPPSAHVGPSPRYFEFVGGTSNKFWEITQAGNTVIVRFGRIGSRGQTQQKVFADEALALQAVTRLVQEKTGKGYIEKATSPMEP